jgi:hypothetical protein
MSSGVVHYSKLVCRLAALGHQRPSSASRAGLLLPIPDISQRCDAAAILSDAITTLKGLDNLASVPGAVRVVGDVSAHLAKHDIASQACGLFILRAASLAASPSVNATDNAASK